MMFTLSQYLAGRGSHSTAEVFILTDNYKSLPFCFCATQHDSLSQKKRNEKHSRNRPQCPQRLIIGEECYKNTVLCYVMAIKRSGSLRGMRKC